MGKSTTAKSPTSTSFLKAVPLHQLQRALKWALDTKLFAQLCIHGNTKWAVPELVMLALFWVWSECTTLTRAFTQASQLCQTLLGKVVLKSYQGFTGALTTWTPKLMPLLWVQLQERMEKIGDVHWRIGLWLPLAVDGSRTTTPRTLKNEKALNSPTFGKGKKAKSRKKWKNKRRRSKPLSAPVHPQIWLTLLWHMGLKMPWAWKCGPSNSSERQHLMDLIETLKFPEKTLFCGDAGFVGYELWQKLAQSHHFFLRVGANVHLLRRLGTIRLRGDLVHFWPKLAAEKNKPPMLLRLLKFQTGRCPMFAVTNILDDCDLTPEQAKSLYQKRWGIEVQFRSLKQTFGRGKLQSRTPERAYMELEWSLLGLWMIQLLTVSEQIPAGIEPEQSSVSVALQVFQDAMWGGATMCLRKKLREAVKDSYTRKTSKKARYRPAKKDKPSAGKPVIKNATSEQKRRYRRIMAKNQKNP